MGGENHGCCQTFKINLARLIYEFIGTLLLTMTFLTHGAGTGRILLALWILTVFCWKVSGSHFNPCISMAYIFRKDTLGLPRLVAMFYMLVQVLGALCGALLMVWLQSDLPPIGPSNQWKICTKPGGCGLPAVPSQCYDPTGTSTKHNQFRAILQEMLGSFIFVFFFMTQTEQQTLLSKEKGIVCLVIACSYVTARSMVFGQFQWYTPSRAFNWPQTCTDVVQTDGTTKKICVTDPTKLLTSGEHLCGISNYGAVLNPAIAFALMLVGPIQADFTFGSAMKWVWLYPLLPFVGALLALVFYEFVFKKAREITQAGEDAEEETEDNAQVEYDADQP